MFNVRQGIALATVGGSRFYHLPAVWPWKCCLTSLSQFPHLQEGDDNGSWLSVPGLRPHNSVLKTFGILGLKSWLRTLWLEGEEDYVIFGGRTWPSAVHWAQSLGENSLLLHFLPGTSSKLQRWKYAGTNLKGEREWVQVVGSGGFH